MIVSTSNNDDCQHIFGSSVGVPFDLSLSLSLFLPFFHTFRAAGCTPFAVSIISDYFPLVSVFFGVCLLVASSICVSMLLSLSPLSSISKGAVLILQELRGTALGVYYWGIYFGYSLAYAIGNGINIALNWHWVFYISGLAGIVLSPFIILTIKEPERKKEGARATPREGENRQFSRCSDMSWIDKAFKKTIQVLKTFCMPGLAFLCFAAGIRNAGGYVWAYNTQPFFELFYPVDVITSYMSWIPLVGGSIGAIVGGIISDILANKGGPYLRTWVLIVSQVSEQGRKGQCILQIHVYGHMVVYPKRGGKKPWNFNERHSYWDL